MVFDFTFFAFAIPATIFAGISKGGFGSGAAFVASAILALILEPTIALGIMLPLLMFADVAALKPFWGKWHTPSAKTIMIGALPGVILGAFFFSMVNDQAIRLLLGAICLIFVAYQLARHLGYLSVAPRPFKAREGYLAGLTGGFSSFVSHAGGPPVAVFLLAQGMSKTAYQATTVLCFWLINILKFVPYAFLGIFSGETFLAVVFLAPFAVLGAYIGIKAHWMIPERLFFTITYVLLAVTGLRLIWISL